MRWILRARCSLIRRAVHLTLHHTVSVCWVRVMWRINFWQKHLTYFTYTYVFEGLLPPCWPIPNLSPQNRHKRQEISEILRVNMPKASASSAPTSPRHPKLLTYWKGSPQSEVLYVCLGMGMAFWPTDNNGNVHLQTVWSSASCQWPTFFILYTALHHLIINLCNNQVDEDVSSFSEGRE